MNYRTVQHGKAFSGTSGILFLFLVVFTVAPASAQTRVWNTVAGAWTNAANWTPMMVPNSSSDVEINGGTSTLDAAGQSQDVYLGRPLLSDGGLEIVGGGQLTSRDIWIGYDGGGEALVNGVGSKWTATGSGKLTVGNSADSAKLGELSIREGGFVQANTTVIGNVDDSAGSILVNGSTLNANTFTIGKRGTATFQVDQGTITSGTTVVGEFADTDTTKYVGEAIMNSGTWTLSSLMRVGDAGIGRLRINGGTMSSGTYSVDIGRQAGSDGEVTTTGGTWSMNGLYVGYSGKGRLFVNQGTVKVQNTGTTYVGRFAGSDGEAVVTGTLFETNGIDIAEAGPGILRAENGSTIKTNGGNIGTYGAANSGKFLINSSMLQDTGRWGFLDRAELKLENGSSWTGTDIGSGIFSPTIQLDGAVATRPTITVNNSTWTNAGSLRIDTGKMTIAAGGSVTNTLGLLGWESVDEGEVEIDGGTWDNTDRLTVGSGGKALLTVKGAGILKSNTAIIADDATSIATVIVDGPGSLWQNTGTLAVGDSNGSGTQGSLILRNGGEVSSTGNIGTIGKGYLGGVGRISGNVSNTTTLDPGYYDAVANDTVQGTLNITGNYTQFGSAKLQIALAATGHDKLDIDGMISLLSTTNLEVSFDAGFNPSAGQSWDILDWGTASSNFVNRFNAILPALDSNEAWDLGQLYTDGIIKVVGTGSVPGDFSGDGVVDSRDYIVLRNNSSSTASDYNTWRSNFGRTSGAGAGARDRTEAVPEPGVAALGLIAIAVAAVQCRCYRR